MVRGTSHNVASGFVPDVVPRRGRARRYSSSGTSPDATDLAVRVNHPVLSGVRMFPGRASHAPVVQGALPCSPRWYMPSWMMQVNVDDRAQGPGLRTRVAQKRDGLLGSRGEDQVSMPGHYGRLQNKPALHSSGAWPAEPPAPTSSGGLAECDAALARVTRPLHVETPMMGH
jgi:hypothetical protein